MVSGFSNSMSMSVQSIRRAAATVCHDHISILYIASKGWLPRKQNNSSTRKETAKAERNISEQNTAKPLGCTRRKPAL